jgi:cell division protein FtsB
MLRTGLVVFGLLTLAILALTLVSERGVFAVRERACEFQLLQGQLADIEARNHAMREEIENLRDPFGGEVERRAREELNLVRPGEMILSLPDEGDSPASLPEANATQPPCPMP